MKQKSGPGKAPAEQVLKGFAEFCASVTFFLAR